MFSLYVVLEVACHELLTHNTHKDWPKSLGKNCRKSTVFRDKKGGDTHFDLTLATGD